MTKTHWYLLAAAGAALVLWWMFVRQPTTVRAPVGSNLNTQPTTGIVGQITDGVAKARAAWTAIFGTPAAAPAGGSAIEGVVSA